MDEQSPYKSLKIRFAAIHKSTPAAVGSRNASAVHLRLPVSFFIVSRVVEHGQCISVKIIKQTAVRTLQPFDKKRARVSDKLPAPPIVPLAA